MLLPLSWLRRYIQTELSAQQIAQHLQDAGIEVDAIDEIRPAFKDIIVGKVVKVEKHPQADRLVIATVFDGKINHQVVCGASNCREGILVPFARIGSRVGTLVIKQVQLKGVDSFGMLAGADELGLEEKSSGLMELDVSFAPGQSLDAFFSDDVLELSLTPDFGHALSILGVARILAARTGSTIKMPVDSFEALQELTTLKDEWEVEINDKALCPRYSALILSQLTQVKTPLWMQVLLQRAGFRLLSPLVDCGNFVMMSLGQPLHCFDQKAFVSRKIRVSFSGSPHQVVMIDGQTTTLPVGTAVVSGSFGPEAVAGVMGMQSSAVSDETSSIIVESAYFSPQAVRKSKMNAGVSSESSRRFERGVDYEATILALALFLQVLKEIGVHVHIDAVLDVKSLPIEHRQIPVRKSYLEMILGYSVTAQELEWVFNRHQFPFKWTSAESCLVTVPPRRHDLHEEIDLVEEVWKLLPIREIPIECSFKPDTHQNHHLYQIEALVRKSLIQCGLQEWVNCSLISPKAANAVVDSHVLKTESLVSVQKPMSIEQSVLRPMLLPGMLESYQRNQNRNERNCQAFEVGNVHMRIDACKTSERLSLSILLAGAKNPFHFEQGNEDVDFLKLKGLLEQFCSLLFISPMFAQSKVSHLHPGRQAELVVHGSCVGVFGEVHPNLLKSFDIKDRVLVAEIDIQDLMLHHKKLGSYQILYQFPGMERDWTVTVDEKISYGRLEQLIRQEDVEFLESFRLQSIFRNERIGTMKKNMTIRFSFRNHERTLTQEEVDASFNRLVASVSSHISQEPISHEYHSQEPVV